MKVEIALQILHADVDDHVHPLHPQHSLNDRKRQLRQISRIKKGKVKPVRIDRTHDLIGYNARIAYIACRRSAKSLDALRARG